MSTIRYFIPEDGDQEDTPNVFLSPKPSRPGYPPLLGQIRGAFPLTGSYHFRFKTALVPGTDREKGAVAVWMDCIDDSEPVPVWQNTIIAKVARIGMDDNYVAAAASSQPQGASQTRAESNSHASPSTTPSSSRSTATPKQQYNHQDHASSSNSSDSLLGGEFDNPPPSASSAPAAAASANLLDVESHHHPAPGSGGSLLDLPAGGTRGSIGGSEHDELLNMSAPVPSRPTRQQQTPMQPQQQFSAQGNMAQIPPPQQQQRSGSLHNQNAFDKFSDPLGGLSWS